MDTISIESTKPFSLDLIHSMLSQHWRVDASTADTLIVHGTKSRAYFHPDTASSVVGRHRLLLDYSEVELAKDLIEKVADNPAFVVDNDFGTVLPGDEFVARIKADRGWDWR